MDTHALIRKWIQNNAQEKQKSKIASDATQNVLKWYMQESFNSEWCNARLFKAFLGVWLCVETLATPSANDLMVSRVSKGLNLGY